MEVIFVKPKAGMLVRLEDCSRHVNSDGEELENATRHLLAEGEPRSVRRRLMSSYWRRRRSRMELTWYLGFVAKPPNMAKES